MNRKMCRLREKCMQCMLLEFDRIVGKLMDQHQHKERGKCIGPHSGSYE